MVSGLGVVGFRGGRGLGVSGFRGLGFRVWGFRFRALITQFRVPLREPLLLRV